MSGAIRVSDNIEIPLADALVCQLSPCCSVTRGRMTAEVFAISDSEVVSGALV